MKNYLEKRGFSRQHCEAIMFCIKGYGVMFLFALIASFDQIMVRWGF